MRKRWKSNLVRFFLWRKFQRLCKCDWHNVRSYLFFNVQKFRAWISDSGCKDLNNETLKYSVTCIAISTGTTEHVMAVTIWGHQGWRLDVGWVGVCVCVCACLHLLSLHYRSAPSVQLWCVCVRDHIMPWSWHHVNEIHTGDRWKQLRWQLTNPHTNTHRLMTTLKATDIQTHLARLPAEDRLQTHSQTRGRWKHCWHQSTNAAHISVTCEDRDSHSLVAHLSTFQGKYSLHTHTNCTPSSCLSSLLFKKKTQTF